MRIAFLFPGQGSQPVGMGRSLAETAPESRAVFSEYAALVAASALDFADAVRAIRLHGRYTQEAVPVGEVRVLNVEDRASLDKTLYAPRAARAPRQEARRTSY